MTLTIGVTLARLLEPKDYGLLMMVTVVTALFGMVSDFGLSTAIVQRQDLPLSTLSTIYWFNLSVASGGAVLLAACSPWIAAFFSQPEIVSLMCIVVLTFPVSAAGAVQSALLQKALRFGVGTRIQVLSSLVAGLLALAAAWRGWGVWALVVQSLGTATVATVALWKLSDWRPRRHFDWQELSSLWAFSLNLMGFGFVNYFIRRADSFLVARYVGAGPLGFYTLAYTLMLYPISNLISVAQGVLIPALSQLQAEPQRIASAYIRACRLLAFLIFPAMIGLALVAREAVMAVYGPKWEETGKVLEILGWVGVFQPFDSLLGAVFVARGFTAWFFRWAVLACCVTVLGFMAGLPWGIIGVAKGYLATQVLLTVFGFPAQCRKVGIPLLPLFRAILVPLAASGCMGVGVAICRNVLTERGLGSSAVFGGCVLAGMVTYASLLLLLRRFFWNELRREVSHLTSRQTPA